MCVLGTCIWCVDTSGQMPVYGRTAGFITVMYECVTEVMPSASEREGKGHSRDLESYRWRPSCFTEWLTHSVPAQAVCSHSSRLLSTAAWHGMAWQRDVCHNYRLPDSMHSAASIGVDYC